MKYDNGSRGCPASTAAAGRGRGEDTAQVVPPLGPRRQHRQPDRPGPRAWPAGRAARSRSRPPREAGRHRRTPSRARRSACRAPAPASPALLCGTSTTGRSPAADDHHLHQIARRPDTGGVDDPRRPAVRRQPTMPSRPRSTARAAGSAPAAGRSQATLSLCRAARHSIDRAHCAHDAPPSVIPYVEYHTGPRRTLSLNLTTGNPLVRAKIPPIVGIDGRVVRRLLGHDHVRDPGRPAGARQRPRRGRRDRPGRVRAAAAGRRPDGVTYATNYPTGRGIAESVTATRSSRAAAAAHRMST